MGLIDYMETESGGKISFLDCELQRKLDGSLDVIQCTGSQLTQEGISITPHTTQFMSGEGWLGVCMIGHEG